MTLGDKIKSAREAKGWIQEQLAEKLGVEPPTVSRWESGENRPRPKHLVKLGNILGLPPGWLQTAAKMEEFVEADRLERERLAQKVGSLEERIESIQRGEPGGLVLPADIIAMLSVLNDSQRESLRGYLRGLTRDTSKPTKNRKRLR